MDFRAAVILVLLSSFIVVGAKENDEYPNYTADRTALRGSGLIGIGKGLGKAISAFTDSMAGLAQGVIGHGDDAPIIIVHNKNPVPPMLIPYGESPYIPPIASPGGANEVPRSALSQFIVPGGTRHLGLLAAAAQPPPVPIFSQTYLLGNK